MNKSPVDPQQTATTVSRSDYEVLQQLFEQAVRLPGAERSQFLAEACQNRPHLRSHLQALLDHDANVELAGEKTRVPNADAPSAVGREIEGYVLLEEIGRGGMGVVYRAQQLSPDRIVALKTIRVGRFASSAERHRFANEIDTIAKLAHDGIVPIYEIGCHHGEHFFTMQLVEGLGFDAYLDSDEFEIRQALAVFSQICDAVAFCHEHGVIHRDLKPSNVLLDQQHRPKLTDFGLAKHLERESTLTRTGEVMGTPGYMAPEQADQSAATVDERADVYGLGAILYRILCGRPPINAADVNLVGAIKLVADNDIIAPKLLNRAVSRDLETICMKCLEGDPAKRYRNARQLADDVRRYLDGDPITARPLTWARRSFRWARQQPGLAVTWFAVMAFYSYHLFCYYGLQLADLSFRYHFVASALAILWATGAYGFQRLLLRAKGANWPLFGWATLDVGLLTFLLWEGHSTKSPLVAIYLVLVAASVLRFRTDLVIYVTLLCFLSFLFHVVRTLVDPSIPDSSVTETVPMTLSILCVGAIQFFALRRSRSAAELMSRTAA